MVEQIFTKIVTIGGVRQTVKVSTPGITNDECYHLRNLYNGQSQLQEKGGWRYKRK